MANYSIQYNPDSNIVNVDDYHTPHSTAIIFYYTILRCLDFCEVRIWCDDCNVQQCIYTCSADKSDTEIIADVNKILDDAIDCYAYDYLVDPDWDDALDDGCHSDGHYRHCPWGD